MEELSSSILWPNPQACDDGRVLFGTLFLAATGSFSGVEVMVRSVSLEEVSARSTHKVWSGWTCQCICSDLPQTCLQLILGLSGYRPSLVSVFRLSVALVCRRAWLPNGARIPHPGKTGVQAWCSKGYFG